ncbi:spore germination protein [Gorillibacterium massiliense]|uniref:spore germination protein n=1 Tax=Gorillibacterium massiliense TaxID=1280390 RepID=UPI0004B28F56|nr:spore germination protein [Gorillibacterium massiliense]
MKASAKNKNRHLPGPTDYAFVSDLQEVGFSPTLSENEQYLKELTKDCSDIVIRSIELNPGLKALVVLVDGLAKSDLVQEVLEDLMIYHEREEPDVQKILDKWIAATQAKLTDNYADFLIGILSGDTGMLVDGDDRAIMIELRGPATRSVSQPTSEQNIRGSQEAFIENIRTNTALLRRRIKTPMLKMYPLQLGRHSHTNVVISYVEGITDPQLVKEVIRKVEEIDIDLLQETGQIEEFIQTSTISPFPQALISERPDSVASALMNGKIAIFVDGTPLALIVPAVFIDFLVTIEDQYERFQLATFLRWLRFIFLVLALLTPAIFVAITTYHPEMLPTSLLLSFAGAREKIPFPAVIEVILMEIIFEALREAGIRMPKQIGSALSILGALVIGQSAVTAGIVSAPVVIVVSITGIASFTMPQFSGVIVVRLLRFPLIILASMLGMYGVILGVMIIIGHVAKLRSFGVPYLSPITPATPDLVNVMMRPPHWASNQRPSYLHPQDAQRKSDDSEKIAKIGDKGESSAEGGITNGAPEQA